MNLFTKSMFANKKITKTSPVMNIQPYIGTKYLNPLPYFTSVTKHGYGKYTCKQYRNKSFPYLLQGRFRYLQ